MVVDDPSLAAGVDLRIDFAAITRQLADAHARGRDFLYEDETYRLLQLSGAETPPRTHLLARGARPGDDDLIVLDGERVVMKIVSPAIVHKTEVGGVRIVANLPARIRSAWRRMLHEVPATFADLIGRGALPRPAAYAALEGDALRAAIAADVRGVLLVQYMPPDSEAFGNEMIVSIRHTREFGPVIAAGLGGTDTELYARRFRKGQAVVTASTAMTDGERFFDLFRRTISYRKLAGLTRGQQRIVTDEQLLECFASFIALANHYSPVNPAAPFVIEELEVNPFAFTDYLMVPLDGLCRFAPPTRRPASRPIHRIGNLLHPATIGLLGVSTRRRNFGRIILDNILANGFPREAVRIVRPDVTQLEGIACVPDLASLETPLDLLVVAVGAEQVPAVVDRILAGNAARAVMLIAGGLGETPASRRTASELMARIAEAHARPGGGPVFLGANCLGVISHPGRYDTLFIPEEKLPKQRGARRRRAAFVSQSGAFMITRLSKRPELDPAYMVSVGNQNDLTLGDLLRYFAGRAELDVIAVYAEGFRDGDGLAFSRAVRDAVLAGKDVIFYKAGRTPEGRTATGGHTASLAGDYAVCEACVAQAGGMVAQTFTQFEDLLLLSQRLHGKRIGGTRLAVLSGAGFEAVGMADNIQADDYALGLAAFERRTVERLQNLLAEKGLAGLVTVTNPLDLNPGADDDAHVRAVQAVASDPGTDAVVVGLDPLSPAMRTLADCDNANYRFDAPDSIAVRMPELVAAQDKPIVGVVDAGPLYDPLVAALNARGMAVFRTSDRAVGTLARYIQGRLQAERLTRTAAAGSVTDGGRHG